MLCILLHLHPINQFIVLPDTEPRILQVKVFVIRVIRREAIEYRAIVMFTIPRQISRCNSNKHGTITVSVVRANTIDVRPSSYTSSDSPSVFSLEKKRICQ